jgi:hypothetical protein
VKVTRPLRLLTCAVQGMLGKRDDDQQGRWDLYRFRTLRPAVKVGNEMALKDYEIKSSRWYINITVTILDIIRRPALN